MKMPFGKYKGEQLEDLPDSYLYWIAENIEGNAELVKEAEDQLAMRQGQGVSRGAHE